MAFLPNPERARALNRDIGQKLAASVDELARACRGVVALDHGALQRRAEALREAPIIRPAVFLLYHECLAAARRDDAETLAVLLGELAATEIASPAGAVRNFGDMTLPREEWVRYRRSLLADPDAPVALAAAPAALFETARNLLTRARQVLSAVDPALAGEIAALIIEYILAQDETRTGGGFGGATAFSAWGAMFLNAARYRSLVAIANGVVHEAAHAWLFALSAGQHLVENDQRERYASPLRADARPMEGIFHATFVSARMAYAMDQLSRSDHLDPAQQGEARQARDDAAAAFETGYSVVRDHARPTPMGRSAMDAAAAYMRSDRPAAISTRAMS